MGARILEDTATVINGRPSARDQPWPWPVPAVEVESSGLRANADHSGYCALHVARESTSCSAVSVLNDKNACAAILPLFRISQPMSEGIRLRHLMVN
jgi:hypothetical protein